MKPLEIQIATHTPVELGPYPLHLDGLLFWTLYAHTDDAGQALAMLEGMLSRQHGVFQASAMAFARTPLEPVTLRQTVHPTCFDWSEWDLPTDRKSIMELGGPFRSRMTKYQAWAAPALIFHAVGDAKAIERVLRATPGIGTNSNKGSGEIRAVSVREVATDHSWFFQGELARTLPVELFPDGPGLPMQARITPPYNVGKTVSCFVPDFRVITCTHTEV